MGVIIPKQINKLSQTTHNDFVKRGVAKSCKYLQLSVINRRAAKDCLL